MKKFIISISLLIIMVSSILAQGTIVTEMVFSRSLEGNFLGDSPDRAVNIYLPPNYDTEDKNYPVVYLLHGYNGNHNLWLGQGYLNMDIKSILDELISQQKIRPIIIVMPNGYNKYHGSWYTNSLVTGNWEDFITKELIEYVDQNYRTLKQPESRGISGHSMGGYGALKIAMKNPELFGSVYCMSTAFADFEDVVLGKLNTYLKQAVSAQEFDQLPWQSQAIIAAAAAFAPNPNHLPFYGDFPIDSTDEIIDSSWLRWQVHDPPVMVLNNLENLLNLDHIALECGQQDVNLYNPNIKLSQLLTQEGIHHSFSDYDGNHINKIPQRVKENMLPFFSEFLEDSLIDSVLIGAEWTKSYGGSGSDWGTAIDQTSDGNYIISARKNWNHWDMSDGWLIKADTNGDTLWTKTFAKVNFSSIQQTTDEGYLICGGTYSSDTTDIDYDVCLIKTDASGDTIWIKKYGGTNVEHGASAELTTDDGYIIICTTTESWNADDEDLWLIKTDAGGDTIWTKTFGGYSTDNGNAVEQTTDGGYIITGSTHSFGAGDSDVWLIKTDAGGNTLWTKTFGGYYSDNGNAVEQTIDGGYIITGSTNSFGSGDSDVWLIKTDVNGDSIWSKTFGGIDYDEASDGQQTSDGGYIIIGSTSSFNAGGSGDAWLIKTDANGDTTWTKTFGGGYDGNAVEQTTDGGYIITGSTDFWGDFDSNVLLIKIGADPTSINENSLSFEKKYRLLQNYPNPFNPSTTLKYEIPKESYIRLKVYDILGREVATLVNKQQKAGYYEVDWNAANNSSGIYFYRINAGEFVETKKMILLR